MPRPPMGAPMSGGHGHGRGGDFSEFNLEEMEKETEEMLKLLSLSEKNCEFSKTEGGFVSLRLKAEGEEKSFSRVVFFCAFPFSDPESFISVRESSEKAKEIGIIYKLSEDFPEKAQSLIREQLKLRYFMPKITKIYSIKDEYGYAYFDVDTDFGRARFAANTGGSSVIPLGDTRLVINDLDGNRFEIADVSLLSAKELKKLDIFL